MRSSTWMVFIVILLCSMELSSSYDTMEKGSYTASVPLDSENRARFDNYRVYYVELDTEKHVEVFQKLEEISDSCTFYGHARNPGQKLTIMVAAHKVADFADLLETFQVNHKILSYNFQEKIDRQMKDVLPKDIDPSKLDWDHYFHLETINAWMEQLTQKHKDLTTMDMGESFQGLSIKGIKLARNPKNPTIFIESGIHAREWIAPATATYILNELLFNEKFGNYANDYNWIIFPVVNPDGYKYTFESDRMWRKNRNLFGISRGVDLNRNYPHHWNEIGCSSDPSRYDFSGTSGGSEVETQRLMKFVQDHTKSENIKTYIALHSFSQLIMFPFGYTAEHVENYNDLKEIGEQAALAIKNISGREYKSGSLYETIYPSSGGSKDWAHAVAGIPITYTFELRGPPDSTDLFILPADEIRPTGEEALAAILTMVDGAKNKGYYK